MGGGEFGLLGCVQELGAWDFGDHIDQSSGFSPKKHLNMDSFRLFGCFFRLPVCPRTLGATGWQVLEPSRLVCCRMSKVLFRWEGLVGCAM